MQKKILLFIGILAILLININNLLAENISIIPLKKPNLTLEEIEEKISKNILKPLKKYRSANANENKAISELISVLKEMPEGKDPAEIQTEVFSVGKNYYPKEKLRDWFKAIYEIVFGDEQGPRMGSFISFFGRKETIKLLEDSLKR